MTQEAKRPSLIRRAGAGLVLACATWLTLGVLGLPTLAGLGTLGDLPWVALVGGALGALGLLAPVWTILSLAIVGIVAVGFFPFLDGRMQRTVRRDQLAGRAVDAVVVLSGTVTAEGQIGPIALDRLLAGMAARRETGARFLVLTTLQRIRRGDTVSSEADQRSLARRYDPEAELELVGPVWNTHDEAVATAKLAARRGWTRIAVVTSSLHTRRACGTFEGAGLQVICRPADNREYSLNLRRAPADRLQAFRDWIYEVVGGWAYRRRGWLPARAKRNVASPR